MAFSRTVTVTGLDEVLKNLSAYADKVKPAAALALATEARDIVADSQKNYVPVDQSYLQSTAYADEGKIEGDVVSAELGYKAEYAAAIHENPRAGKTGGVSPSGRKYQHYATTGGWKYLELPLLAAEKGMLGRLADRIRSAVGGKLAAEFYGGK